MHVKQKRKIECIVPASGLVTALEPVLRACGGLWLAHGAGDADRESCDENNKVRVPPEEPAYVLKRIWLTQEEEEGHYYGFSNEGIWPLCHITHTRPVFRLDDWVQYQTVNEKFAQSILEEVKHEDSPLILIQDYHFALLPFLIRKERPDARIALFWHIPWPNPESFGICPWKQEILLGMLGADIIGFHIQFHCNNFLDTVDSVLESKINWEQFSVQRENHATLVRPFPISVGTMPDTRTDGNEAQRIRETLAKEYGIHAKHVGVGVDRLDYTKGIIERFRGIERFLEKYPDYVENFVFVELGAPSRTHIPKYHDFISEVEKTVDTINSRFQTKEWKPIVFLKAHHSHSDILPFYKTADVCLVTSLHDGMNLVSKEFIASRSDESGVLILSQFTGASRELRDAVIVNPYDTEAMADSLRLALKMPDDQKRERMKRLRSVVQDKNIYRWAANLITAMTQLPAKPNPKAVRA
jgi:trehalose-6-phosphate synthase